MPVIVQSDVGDVDGANSYNSVAEFKAYHDARGNSYAGFTDASIEAALVRATDYLDSRFRYVGSRKQSYQTTEWPKWDALDSDERLIDGVHPAVKRAHNEYALRALSSPLAPDPTQDASGARLASTSSTAGPVSESKTFAAGGAFQMPDYPAADGLLRAAGLVRSGRRVARG